MSAAADYGVQTVRLATVEAEAEPETLDAGWDYCDEGCPACGGQSNLGTCEYDYPDYEED